MVTTATRTRPNFSDTDLIRLQSLIKKSDSVELKLTVPESEHASTVAALGVDPLNAQIRQVYFFDTPQLSLDRHGLVVRARRIQRKGDDTVVKLRPIDPAELPAELRDSASFGVEVDAVPGGFVCSGSLRGAPHSTDVRTTVTGGQPLHKLFSKEQRQLFGEHAPDGIELDALSVLGPIFVLKVKFTPPELGYPLVGEMWLYPDGSRILELSTRCVPSDAFQVAAEARAYLASHQIDLSGEQQTKTHKALDFFARRLR
jgi:hypothetical protein